MSPIRRYLRITRHSAIEVRIYLQNPALAQSWLLSPRNDVLTRIITAIRPYVERQLREEDARIRGKTKKKKGVKDEVHGEDFEVSIFLTDPSTRHSLLLKHKDFKSKSAKIRSNSGKLTGWLTGGQDKPIEFDEDEDEDEEASVIIREESDDDADKVIDHFSTPATESARGSKRRRETHQGAKDVEEISEDEGFETQQSPATKKARAEADSEDEDADDKKKMGLATSYEGFSIYGRVLCLVVKRKGGGLSNNTQGAPSNGRGQQMMESWVSTQAAQELQGIEED
ncbi:MAG: hypothetical protein M1828_000232 [Chrysothrix sp. TS-e1954]|nr:MAG: hypothetical protein M1828_000232 [Chrysothrix sp. TS-e1954]